jgi:hypothetical protein
VTYGYNSASLRASLSLQQPSGTWTNGFTYDAAQNLNKRTNNGTPTTFTVNNLNQVTGDGTSASTHDCNPDLRCGAGGNRTTKVTGISPALTATTTRTS